MKIRRDHRDLALGLAPSPLKAVLVSLTAGMIEIFESDPAAAVDGVATVLERRMGRAERSALLMLSAAAAHPEDLYALVEAVVRSHPSSGTIGAPVCPEPPSRYRPRPLSREERRRADAIPPFDLPEAEFRAMMCASSAPLAARKNAVVRLLITFDDADKRACAEWLLKQVNARRAA